MTGLLVLKNESLNDKVVIGWVLHKRNIKNNLFIDRDKDDRISSERVFINMTLK
jgi:hypothetical protein